MLDTKTNMANATEGDGLFLLSDVLLGTGDSGGVYFQQNYHSVSDTYHKGSAPSNGDHRNCQIANAWQGSDAQDWCETFYNDSLTTQEQSAVLETTKSDGEFTSSTDRVPFAASENILNGDKVFFLSAEEAENSAYGFTDVNARIAYYGNHAGNWWLRSPYANYTYTYYAGAVYSYGYVIADNVCSYWAARPAFNLDLNSVLFTSAATGGKPDGGLTAVDAYTGNEWKLTLLDSSRNNFAVSDASLGGSTISFSYSDARIGTNEYISAVIEDNGVITYYGRILQLSDTTTGPSGKASLSLPDGVALSDTTRLYVFNEQYNGDYKTDYASPLQNISPASVPDPDPDPGPDPGPNPDPNPNPNPNPNYNQPPVIIIPTTDQNVSASVGNTVTMRITANYAQSYQWYVDTGSGFKAIPGATGAAYTTSQVALGNNGYRYYCVARNAYGTAVSPVFTLNVLEYMGIPATGDSAQAGLWIGLMMIALAGLAACAVLYRKRKQER